MIREIIKISAGSPSSYSLPRASGHGSPLPGDQFEGPVRVVEGAEQAVDKGQASRLAVAEMGEGWKGDVIAGKEEQEYHAKIERDKEDIGREDSTIEMISPSEIVEAMTKFSLQKPGGQFDPTIISLPYCIFCKKGCICLGPNCMGHEKMVPKLTLRNPPVSTKIPGLEGQQSTTLTNIQKTHTKHHSRKIFLPFDSFFQAPSHFFSSGTKAKSRRKRTAGNTKKTIFNCSTSVYDVQLPKLKNLPLLSPLRRP